MVKLPKHKLAKQNNKKVGRSAKHKQGTKAVVKRMAKEMKAEIKANTMETDEEPVEQRTDEQKAADKKARKLANIKNNLWKKTSQNVTAKNGPRNVSGH
jgi:hypothetical protein